MGKRFSLLTRVARDCSGAAASRSELKLEDTARIKFLNTIVLIGNKNIV